MKTQQLIPHRMRTWGQKWRIIYLFNNILISGTYVNPNGMPFNEQSYMPYAVNRMRISPRNRRGAEKNFFVPSEPRIPQWLNRTTQRCRYQKTIPTFEPNNINPASHVQPLHFPRLVQCPASFLLCRTVEVQRKTK